MPRNVVAEMARQHPRIGIVAATRAVADQELDRLTMVEALDRIVGPGRPPGEQCQRQGEGYADGSHGPALPFSRWPHFSSVFALSSGLDSATGGKSLIHS